MLRVPYTKEPIRDEFSIEIEHLGNTIKYQISLVRRSGLERLSLAKTSMAKDQEEGHP